MKILLSLLLAGFTLSAETFEVASIKKSEGGGGMRGGCHGINSKYAATEVASAPPLGRCVVRDARLSHLLFIAYHLRSMAMLRGGADWVSMGDDRFNLEAKVEDPSKYTEEQLFQMLQDLIIERFSVKLHQETKEVPGFALVIAKNGPKLKEAKGDVVSATFSPTFKPNPKGPNTLTARKYSISALASLLTLYNDPIMDQTGLTGDYDFTLSWNEEEGPAMSTALQQQLGLKFESRKVPVTTIVIDSAKKPTEN
jgi:uncharacterized protein (TIGR03435 family)